MPVISSHFLSLETHIPTIPGRFHWKISLSKFLEFSLWSLLNMAVMAASISPFQVSAKLALTGEDGTT